MDKFFDDFAYGQFTEVFMNDQGVFWYPGSNGAIPPNAFQAGTVMRKKELKKVFCVRASSRNFVKVLGMLIEGESFARIPYGTTEHMISNYDILTAADPSVLYWKQGQNGHTDKNTLIVCQHIFQNNPNLKNFDEVLHIGRTITVKDGTTWRNGDFEENHPRVAMENESRFCGKIHPSHRCLYVPFGGNEYIYRHYEVLCIRPVSSLKLLSQRVVLKTIFDPDSFYSWVEQKDGNVPPHAVDCGKINIEGQQKKVYLATINWFSMENVAGFLIEGENFAKLPFSGENIHKSYKILTSKHSVEWIKYKDLKENKNYSNLQFVYFPKHVSNYPGNSSRPFASKNLSFVHLSPNAIVTRSKSNDTAMFALPQCSKITYSNFVNRKFGMIGFLDHYRNLDRQKLLNYYSKLYEHYTRKKDFEVLCVQNVASTKPKLSLVEKVKTLDCDEFYKFQLQSNIKKLSPFVNINT